VLVYVAGPYRAETVNGVFDNIAAARAVAVELWQAGFTPVVPHLNSAFMGGVVGDQVILDGDLEILEAISRADGVALFIAGWSYSRGCQIEYEFCQTSAISIFEDVADLIAWANEQA